MLKKAETHQWTLETETETMWQVCAALWKTDYNAAYRFLNDLTHWSALIKPMISDILGKNPMDWKEEG